MADDTMTETIKRDLPTLLREDPELRRYVIELTRSLYAERDRTEDRFDRILDELLEETFGVLVRNVVEFDGLVSMAVSIAIPIADAGR